GGAAIGFRMRAHRGAAAPSGAKRLIVVPLENRTGDPKLEAIGTMAADWTTRGLTETGLVEVVPTTTVLTVVRVLAGRDSMARAPVSPTAIARETGAGYSISGAYYVEGDSLRFEEQVTDVLGDRVLASIQPVTVSRDNPRPALEQLSRRV